MEFRRVESTPTNSTLVSMVTRAIKSGKKVTKVTITPEEKSDFHELNYVAFDGIEQVGEENFSTPPIPGVLRDYIRFETENAKKYNINVDFLPYGGIPCPDFS